jgi:hypothetical protein
LSRAIAAIWSVNADIHTALTSLPSIPNQFPGQLVGGDGIATQHFPTVASAG